MIGLRRGVFLLAAFFGAAFFAVLRVVFFFMARC